MRTKIGAPPLGPNEIHARTQSGEMRCWWCRSKILSRVNDVQCNELGLGNVDFHGCGHLLEKFNCFRWFDKMYLSP
jgi:hypothetical protein